MNIVLLGGPGSGKGTVSNLFEQTQNMGHIATGDMFREEIKNGTELGRKAQEYIDKGNLVPDEITINMLKGKINQFKDSNGVVFDGFPRNKKRRSTRRNARRTKSKSRFSFIFRYSR